MKWLCVALYFAGMVVEIIVRMPYDRQRRKISKTDQRVTLAERSLLAGLSGTMLLLPGIYGLTPWLNFANYNWIPTTSALVGSGGVPVLVIAIWLF